MMRLVLIIIPVPLYAEVGNSVSSPSLSSWLLSSMMVIGLILILGIILKKSKIVTIMGSGQMKIIASLPLGYKEKLLVVKVGEQQFLLGVTPQQINFLYRLESQLNEDEPHAFSTQLSKLMSKHEKS
ncbi:flagellar biosynthetic protein FliO [Aeromonas cavernicola]|uniref:Flagellar protein n=1 Tax=Aeromonas cavernicola TaxID=1006623 RepID=A0A2H9U9A9_9GAMM|nr:flagellar biosynthetic protein FliO [Aeromonas cavernicola]PJG60616.1 flagellar biosynthetic protein FliO [Aeromonas cavernicola]